MFEMSNPFEALGRANYTATALNLFTLPLVGSRTAGLPAEQLSHVDAATRASMELANILPTPSVGAVGPLSRLAATAPPSTPSVAWPDVGSSVQPAEPAEAPDAEAELTPPSAALAPVAEMEPLDLADDS